MHPALRRRRRRRGDARATSCGSPASSRASTAASYVNVGSAVVLPEVFLKAVAVVHNADPGAPRADHDGQPRHAAPLPAARERRRAPGGARASRSTGHHEITLPLLRARRARRAARPPGGGAVSRALAEVLAALGAPRVVVVGDLMVDRYVTGVVERISPEAPIQVLRAESRRASASAAPAPSPTSRACSARDTVARGRGRRRRGGRRAWPRSPREAGIDAARRRRARAGRTTRQDAPPRARPRGRAAGAARGRGDGRAARRRGEAALLARARGARSPGATGRARQRLREGRCSRRACSAALIACGARSAASPWSWTRRATATSATAARRASRRTARRRGAPRASPIDATSPAPSARPRRCVQRPRARLRAGHARPRRHVPEGRRRRRRHAASPRRRARSST